LKSGVLIHEVPGDPSTGFAFSLDAYKKSLAEARAQGRTVRAVLLCNPHNPCGTILTRAELESLVEWVRSEPGLHLVADEIYALSTYAHRLPSEEEADEEAAQPALSRLARSACGAVQQALWPSNDDSVATARSPFVSLCSLLPNAAAMAADGARFHVVYAFSKDFGLSGFRCGMVITENRAVRRGFDQLAQFNGLSQDVAYYFYLLLRDRRALPRFVEGMQTGLAQAVTVLGRDLRQAGIPFVRPSAGLFLWIDLSGFLDAPGTVDAETRLYKAVLAECNVNLTPGTAFHSPQPGWFRFIFTNTPLSTMRVALQRIITLLQDAPRLQQALQRARDS
jgi:1-aminocyclopropane-1-carboxylate synthase